MRNGYVNAAWRDGQGRGGSERRVADAVRVVKQERRSVGEKRTRMRYGGADAGERNAHRTEG